MSSNYDYVKFSTLEEVLTSMETFPNQGPLSTFYGGEIKGNSKDIADARRILQSAGIKSNINRSGDGAEPRLVINILPEKVLEKYNNLNHTALANETGNWKSDSTYVTSNSAASFAESLQEMERLVKGPLKEECILLKKDLWALKNGEPRDIPHSQLQELIDKVTDNFSGFRVSAVARDIKRELPNPSPYLA